MADVGQAAEGKVLVSPGWSVLQEMASLMQVGRAWLGWSLLSGLTERGDCLMAWCTCQ
jgi:hypothetical protein